MTAPIAERARRTPNHARRQLVIAALTAGRSKSEAAAAGGITVRTLRRWQQDQDFQTELDHACAALTKHVDARIRALVTKATGVLDAILDRHDLPALQLRASVTILHYQLKARPYEIAQRLEELEQTARVVESAMRSVTEHMRQLDR